MHGCPPAEIERIGRYLIVDKGFDTYVKLNPTLVGYDRARAILDGLGWTDIVLKRESFEHDLQFPDALKLIANLKAAAEDSGREFGIKLSNTLANANSGTFLPGAERYMSGRALFPITAALAAQLAAALPDFGARFSYCGGVSALNAAELVGAGMAPLTIATDILKPGGYQRLLAVAQKAVGVLSAAGEAADAAEGGAPEAADAGALAALAAAAGTRREYRKDWKEGCASIAKPLPLFDCFAAPCIEACPVHQKVPAYIQASASGESAQALATILSDNPLPHITGVLCDHVCQEHCSRVDYEGSVRIRDVKLACARAGKDAGYASDSAAAIAARILPEVAAAAAAHGPVAVVGAGPAGLACAHHLALAGMAVTVFDGARRPGGVPVNVIPKFRIDRQDIAADMGRIEALGVKFETGRAIATAQELRASGYRAIFLGIGADSARSLGLSGSGIREIDALESLGTLSENPEAFEGARHIVVAGGGNTAMDAVRSATRVRGVKDVKLSYRRTTAEMPADREELENALAEAAALAGPDSNSLFALTLPESAVPGRLTLRKMVLGDRDASGRHSPLPSAETLELDCDLIVSAIGESPDGEVLAAFGLNLGKDGRPLADPQTMMAAPGVYVGGDARRGPASIIAAEADGRRAAYAILRAAGIEPPAEGYVPPPAEPAVLARRGDTLPSLDPSDPDFVAREAERCLKCDSACLRCVEVCPNRANAFVEVGAPFAQGMQIVHVDRLCNECGNCGVFCPYEGEPYRAKPTVFDTTAELEASKNPGFAFVEPPGFPKSGKRGPAVPDLALRNDRASSVRRYSHAEWNGANLPSGSESMISLARAVWRGHRYLVGGMK
jgi:putative selenate reductase